MKIDFSSPILDLDGKPAVEGLTLYAVCAQALQATFQDEQSLPAAEKLERFRLLLKIHDAKVAELTAEEITRLKTVVGMGWSTIVVGRAYQLLDPASAP